MTAWHEQDCMVPASHPSAAGHFPGNPIIPGALLLDAMVAAIAGSTGSVTIHTTKFLAPIPHGTALRLRWQNDGAKTRFECRTADDRLVLTGSLTSGAP